MLSHSKKFKGSINSDIETSENLFDLLYKSKLGTSTKPTLGSRFG